MFCSLIEPFECFEDKFHVIKADFPKFVWLSVACRDIDLSLITVCVILHNTELVVTVETVPQTEELKALPLRAQKRQHCYIHVPKFHSHFISCYVSWDV
jgi:hypothetical protein